MSWKKDDYLANIFQQQQTRQWRSWHLIQRCPYTYKWTGADGKATNSAAKDQVGFGTSGGLILHQVPSIETSSRLQQVEMKEACERDVAEHRREEATYLRHSLAISRAPAWQIYLIIQCWDSPSNVSFWHSQSRAPG